MLIAIAAMTENRLIGNHNTLPWYIPEDLQRFKQLTMRHTVIMWRKTYESLPDKFRPLPWRHNIIITSQKDYNVDSDRANTSVEIIHTLEQAIQRINNNPTKKIFIIWWSQIYQLFLEFCDELYITEVIWDYKGDSYFPEFEDKFTEILREDHKTYNFVTYKKI